MQEDSVLKVIDPTPPPQSPRSGGYHIRIDSQGWISSLGTNAGAELSPEDRWRVDTLITSLLPGGNVHRNSTYTQQCTLIHTTIHGQYSIHTTIHGLMSESIFACWIGTINCCSLSLSLLARERPRECCCLSNMFGSRCDSDKVIISSYYVHTILF